MKAKKILVVCLVLSSIMPALSFASRARVLVLGSGDAGRFLNTSGSGGSLLVDDESNIFYNPSYVVDFKNWGTIEKSNFAGTTGVGTTAQGGAATSMGSLQMGAYFNRVSAVSHHGNANSLHPIDVFMGTSAGDVKIGAGLTYGNFKNTRGVDQDLTVHLGAQAGPIAPFGSFRVLGTEKSTTTGGKHRHWQFGLKAKIDEVGTPFAAVRQDKKEGSKTVNLYGFGMGRQTQIATQARLNYSLGFWRNSAQAGSSSNANRTTVPVNIAVEGDAATWVVLRAGFSFALWDRAAGYTVSDTTTGRLGASFKWSQLELDWAIGTAGTGSETATSLDGQAFAFDNGLFTAASLTYRW